MAQYQIPLENIPQTFEIALAGKTYKMTCKWNDSDEGGWALDFVDALTNDPIAFNLPLITGGDVLAGLGYLGFGGQMIVYTDGDETAVPTLENLGGESNLYFITED
jgi:hypothetical protein